MAFSGVCCKLAHIRICSGTGQRGNGPLLHAVFCSLFILIFRYCLKDNDLVSKHTNHFFISLLAMISTVGFNEECTWEHNMMQLSLECIILSLT